MIAVILDSGRLERLYTGLSLLVSAAAEGRQVWACAPAVEATGTARADVEARLDGVMSTPSFLREVSGSQLVMC